jgi:DNA-directed RNA polymerase subunit M/transcription elongation factor TFIIS
MPIETRCRGCGKILSAGEEHAGKLARCPRCKAEYTIPEESDLAALDAVCHYCGAVLEDGQQTSESYPACDECRHSIAENQADLQEEAAKANRQQAGCLILSIIVAVIIFLTSFLLHLQE